MSAKRNGDHSVGRALSALPDLVSCSMFLLAWIAPMALGAIWIKNLMITMILEFLSVHSGGFIGTALVDPGKSRANKTRIVLVFGLFYMLFAAAFSLAFEAWWPAAVFAWLLLAKFAQIWLVPLPGPVERTRQTFFIGFGVLCYVLGVFATTFLPLPTLGIDADVRAAAAIPGSGLWVDEPHRVIAFGALYFGAMAWAKWRWRPGTGLARSASAPAPPAG